MMTEFILARSEDNPFPFQVVGHFPYHEEVAFLHAKEVIMCQIRAPPERSRIHTQTERPFSINSERAAHPARCTALFVFHSTLQVRLLS
jgi:hypothetical protein